MVGSYGHGCDGKEDVWGQHFRSVGNRFSAIHNHTGRLTRVVVNCLIISLSRTFEAKGLCLYFISRSQLRFYLPFFLLNLQQSLGKLHMASSYELTKALPKAVQNTTT